MFVERAKRVLVIRHGAFGDLVQIDGVLRDIRAHHPDAEIVLLTSPAFAKLMSRCPHVDRILTDSRAPYWHLRTFLGLWRTFVHEAFDKVYDLQKTDRTQLYRRLMLRHSDWSGQPPRTAQVSAMAGYVEQLQQAGVPVTNSERPHVDWMAADISALLDEKGLRRPWVFLVPGCSAKHPQKRWPYFDQLADRLLALGIDCCQAPGPDELELAATIPGHVLMRGGRWLDWFELAGVIQAADFVVGNDTGPSHVASCLGKSGLALFGPHTSAERTGIVRGGFQAMEVPNLAELSVDDVLARILAGMARQPEAGQANSV